jgi:hypothetical protein
MKTSLVLATMLVAAGATAGCTGFRKAIGAEKTVPDEFRVVTKAPLVMPPDYALRPPRPGEPRPVELNTSADARTAVFGQDIGTNASEGEKLLVAKAGAAAVDPDIRQQVDFEGAAIVRKSDSYSDQILSYGKTSAASASDPAAEKARLDREEAARRATGGGTVTIERGDTSHFKLPGL